MICHVGPIHIGPDVIGDVMWSGVYWIIWGRNSAPQLRMSPCEFIHKYRQDDKNWLMRRRQSEAKGSAMCKVGGSGLPVSEQCEFVMGWSIHWMPRMGMMTTQRMMEWIQQRKTDANGSAMVEHGARGETEESASPTRSQQIDAVCQ
jgi:hypothetical protein